MNLNPIIDYLHRLAEYNHVVVAVEFALIGIVVYWLVNFLEGTRGERLFRGVLFIMISASLVLNLLVERFQFERLEYLYKGFLISILVIAVAAFQPELRRALIRIGQARFLTGSSPQLSRTVEEIINAAKHMAKTRTGALIVLEQQVGLGEFIETGVKVYAKVTAELLETIFYKGTPLHDMAVIVRGDQIIAASVQLPLAEGGSVEVLELGSRHRAAIGITSSTDATVVVVSEETGIVSIAINGNLIRDLNDSQLRKHLTNAVSATGIVERFWKGPRKTSQDAQ